MAMPVGIPMQYLKNSITHMGLQRVPLRFLLVVPVILQIVVITSLVGYFSVKNSQRVITDLEDRLTQEMGDRTYQTLNTYLDRYRETPQSPRQNISPTISPARLPTDIAAAGQAHSKQPAPATVNPNHLPLAGISYFLKQYISSPAERIFILDRQGNLIASSHIELAFPPSGKAPTQPTNQHQDPLIQQITQQLRDRFGSLAPPQQPPTFRIHSNGQKVIQVRNYQDAHGLDWLIVIAVPDSEFTAAITANTQITILLCLLSLVIATGIGLLTARWITHPLKKLNQAAQSITDGRWDDPISLNRNDEVGELARSFYDMVWQLQTAFAERDGLNLELTASKDRLSQILDAIPLGVGVIHTHGKKGYLNQVGQSLLGMGAQPNLHLAQLAIAYHLYQTGTEQYYPVENLPIYRALQGEVASADDIEVRREGQVISLEIKAIPVFGANGKVSYAITTFQDITARRQAARLLEEYNQALEREVQERTIALEQEIAERKQTEAALRQTEAQNLAIIKAMPDLIYSVDAAGIFLDYSRTKQVHDLVEENIDPVGRTLAEILPDEVAYRHQYYLQRALATGKLQTYEQKIWIDNIAQYEEVRVMPTSHDRVLFIIRDISDRKRAEAALKQAKEAAEAANHAKSTFLAGMSHELRTPLNAILGFAQIMCRDPAIRPEHRQNLEIINRSGEHLLDLINSVLDLSKIEAGRMELIESSFNLPNLIETVGAMLQGRAKAKGVELHIHIEPTVPTFVISDPGKLRQVLINLLGNAIKFTDQGSVTLHVGNSTEMAGDGKRSLPNSTPDDLQSAPHFLHFTVKDTGIGIDPEDLHRIFEAFEQTSSGKQVTGGTGLGLTLSRNFIELMGGTISVTSTPDAGSTFAFDIIVRLTETSTPHQPELLQPITGILPDQPSYRILVADDQLENREILIRVLQPIGFSVRLATNGVEAIALWQQWHPHLILMDIQMPLVDGLKAAQDIRLKERELGIEESTRILALSASVFPDDCDRAIASGCDGFFTKPFRTDELLEKIGKLLDIKYAYAPVSASATTAHPSLPDGVLLPDLLTTLPPSWVQQLHQAATIGDDAKILQLLGQLAPSHKVLADGLRELARHFQFDRILSLLEGNSDQ